MFAHLRHPNQHQNDKFISFRNWGETFVKPNPFFELSLIKICEISFSECRLYIWTKNLCLLQNSSSQSRTRLDLQRQTSLRSYPLSFIPYPLSLISTPCSLSPSTFHEIQEGCHLILVILVIVPSKSKVNSQSQEIGNWKKSL